MTFGERLKGWRDAAGVNGNMLDRYLGKSRGTTAQIENGKCLPPDRDLCDGIDASLGLKPGESWAASAPDRLRRFDPELWMWHLDQIGAADAVRGLLDDHGSVAGLARRLAELEEENTRLHATLERVRRALD